MSSLNRKTYALSILISGILVSIGYYLLLPIQLNLSSDADYNNYLVQVIDKNAKVLESNTIDKNFTLDAIKFLKYTLDGSTIRVIHPLLKKQMYAIGISDIFNKEIAINLTCWCADEAYPKQQDLTLIYSHFEDIKTHYIEKVDVQNRRVSVEGMSKQLYLLIAIASDRVGSARRLRKEKVRSMKQEMGEILGDLYVDKTSRLK